MSRRGPHLLQVDAPPESFAPLLAAIAAAGLRAGWLELRPPAPPAPALAAAAALGAARAVAAGGGLSVAVKPLRGEPVLRDVLREHFRGCALVLVSGAAPAGAPLPRLAAEGDGWRVTLAATTAASTARGESAEAADTASPADTSSLSDTASPADTSDLSDTASPADTSNTSDPAAGAPQAAAALHLDTAGLLAALRRPHPWPAG